MILNVTKKIIVFWELKCTPIMCLLSLPCTLAKKIKPMACLSRDVLIHTMAKVTKLKTTSTRFILEKKTKVLESRVT